MSTSAARVRFAAVIALLAVIFGTFVPHVEERLLAPITAALSSIAPR